MCFMNQVFVERSGLGDTSTYMEGVLPPYLFSLFF